MHLKHAEVIRAWLDGAEIQGKNKYGKEWRDLEAPGFHEDSDYRVKPGKVYPETGMSYLDFGKAVSGGTGPISINDAIKIANAAIRHAIDSGQVVVPESAMSQQK